MILRYRPFPRNIDILGDRAKKQFLRKNQLFKVVSKYRPIPRNIDSLGVRAEKQFFRKKSILSK